MKRLSAAFTSAAVVIATAGLVATAAPALAAAVGCTFDGEYVTAYVEDPAPSTDYVLGVTGGGAIQFGGTSCGAATTANTRAISLVPGYSAAPSPSQAPHLVIDHSNPFGPGVSTGDVNGTDHIKITLETDSLNWPLDVRGGSGADLLRAAEDGIDLDSDDDAVLDVTYHTNSNTYYRPLVNLLGKNGNDVLSSTASSVTVFVPGAGTNTVTGGPGVFDLVSFADCGCSSVAATVNGAVTPVGGTEVDTMSNIEGLIGTAGADTLDGDGNDNWLEGAGGADHVNGGAGRDTMSFQHAAQGVTVDLTAASVSGGGTAAGADFTSVESVFGTEHDDVLLGSGGMDTLDGYTGSADLLDGRLGDDTLLESGYGHCAVDYSTAPAAVQLYFYRDPTTGSDIGQALGGSGLDALQGCTELTMTPYGDTVHGSEVDESVSGGGGNDLVEGGGGVDALAGGPGTDTLSYESVALDTATDLLAGTSAVGLGVATISGFENVKGGSGPDLVKGIPVGAHDLALGAGTDTVDFTGQTAAVQVTLDDVADDGPDGLCNVHSDVENATGGSGNDVLYGSNVANALDGGAGNDTVIGRGGNDVLQGGAGADTVQGSTGDDRLLGGVGNDVLGGGDGADVLHGDADTDSLTGGAGDDDVYGDAGNDALLEPEAGNGADYLSGGLGTDHVSYAGRTAAVRIALDGVPNDGAAGEYDHVLTDVENATGGSGADTLIGSSLANVLHGGPGNDLLDGKLGADTLYGDTGVDSADYRSRTSAVTASLNNVADDGQSGEADNVRSDVENLYGGSGSDRLTGSGTVNYLYGGSGNDTLNGGGGADRLDGVAGNDVLYARDGVKDTVIGGIGTDKAQVDATDGRSGVESLF